MSKRWQKNIWKPFGLNTKDHTEFKQEITEALLDLDFVLRCYYLAMSDDLSLTEKDRFEFMQKAFCEALAATGDSLPDNPIHLQFKSFDRSVKHGSTHKKSS